jgi:hypothetical protein
MLNQLRDVFACLQKHDVKYVVIGGIAAVLHGVPRATFDLDMLIEATPENARRLLDAFADAGLGTATMTTIEDILAHDVTIFNDRVRIDVQTKTPGIEFDDVWVRRKIVTYQKQQFYILSLTDLIASKQAAGRPKDIEDINALQAGDD